MADGVHLDYSTVTELPGGRASRQQWARLCHRYQLAASHAAGRDVLEVGCGAGVGLGWLARVARRVVGGDYTPSHLHRAQGHYQGRVPLLRLDALALPFRRGSFDLIVLFETLYYLERPGEFLAECARVLRPRGMVLVGSVNPQWSDFHPSPFARRYFSAAELRELLRRGGFEAAILGSFCDPKTTRRARALSWLRRAAGRSGLIPRTMRGKEILKRLFFGPLRTLPAELAPNGGSYAPPAVLDSEGCDADYTVLYAVGRLPPQQYQQLTENHRDEMPCSLH
jgi:ubiquinone/menaquinone biosynthesis C-methylase UbiE